VTLAWWSLVPGDSGRAEIVRQLETSGGRHLVIVHYLPGHDPHQEWVSNDADIDRSTIVWARDMGAGQNRELVDYFRGRRIWLIEPDRTPPQLLPYPGGAGL